MKNTDWCKKSALLDTRIRDWIDGQEEFHDCENGILKRSPRDGSKLYTIDRNRGDAALKAIDAAKSSFERKSWRRNSVIERKTTLLRIAELIDANAEELALCESLDVGKPITNVLHSDIPQAASAFRKAAELLSFSFGDYGSDGGNSCYVKRKPVGVVAAIVGWNFPLVLAANKIAPAIATGNSVVVKPSENSSLSTWRLAKIAEEAGLPRGVLNVVNGTGVNVGEVLALNDDVDLLSFTGSTETGKQLMKSAGNSNMKRLMLECGGKSPYIVFEDCPNDLGAIASDIVTTAFPNQGAYCSAGTRLLVHDTVYEKLLPLVAAAAAKIKVGDPLDSETVFGALVSEEHLNKVLSYVEKGKSSGARLLSGGNRIVGGSFGNGVYMSPAVFDSVAPKSPIAQEEIFGPVLSAMSFSDDAEAVQLANSTKYGLAAYIATENAGRIQRMSNEINAGYLVVVGTTSVSGGLPELGGEPHKQSGFGFEGGLPGLNAYTVSTSVQLLT